MRNLLIVGAVGILSLAAWIVTLVAAAQGRGWAQSSQYRRGLEVQVEVRRHGGGGGRSGRMFFATEVETIPLPNLFPGQPLPGPAAPDMFAGGAEMGEPEHVTAERPLGTASHHLAHVPGGVEGREPYAQSPAPTAADSDQAGAATAQPDPTANPSVPHPPAPAARDGRSRGGAGQGCPDRDDGQFLDRETSGSRSIRRGSREGYILILVVILILFVIVFLILIIFAGRFRTRLSMMLNGVGRLRSTLARSLCRLSLRERTAFRGAKGDFAIISLFLLGSGL